MAQIAPIAEADLFTVPLLDGGVGLGQVISPDVDGAVQCLISDLRGSAPRIIPEANVLSVLYTQGRPFQTQSWTVIGYDTLPAAARSRAPALAEPPTVQDPAVIEAFLNAVHGLYPWTGSQIRRSSLLCCCRACPSPRPAACRATSAKMAHRIDQQLAFLVRADALKTVSRANVALGGARRENTAEHSWHLALWAMVFADLDLQADPDRTLLMCLLHDLVEVFAGDHPVHQGHDPFEVAQAEADAADRIFPILPDDQAAHFHDVWEDFERGDSPEARLVRMFDMAHPVFQELANPALSETDSDVLRAILVTGRAAALADHWPELHAHALALLNRTGQRPPEPLAARLRFLAEADALKGILRGTPIFDGSRRENSAEHSWHLALFAHVLAEHGPAEADPARAAAMLILHDLVEIDAGDQPIHGRFDAAAQEAKERAAADRLFGLLPADQGTAFRALWDTFEASETPEALYAKSVDRVQPVMANLESGGGTWITYNVTRGQLETRVGTKVLRGVPPVWDALAPRIDAWFNGR